METLELIAQWAAAKRWLLFPTSTTVAENFDRACTPQRSLEALANGGDVLVISIIVSSKLSMATRPSAVVVDAKAGVC